MRVFPNLLGSLCLATAGVLLAAGQARAQDQMARLMQLMSADFARQSDEALMRGDRKGAVAFALRGLPAEFTDADRESFRGAHDALFRAVASRSFRIERDGFQYFNVNSTGDRAVVGDFTLDDTKTLTHEPHVLVDPNTGEILAELLPPESVNCGTSWPANAPSFSPDGAFLVIPSFKTGIVHLFDAETGEELEAFSGHGAESGGRVFGGMDLGFSPDGRFLATTAHQVISIWEMQTGQLEAELPMQYSQEEAQYALGWAHDGTILVLVGSEKAERGWEYNRIVIEAWDVNGGSQTRADLSSILNRPPVEVKVSPFSPHIAIWSETSYLVVDLDDVSASFNVPSSGMGAAFVRNGAAFATTSWPLTEGNVTVYDLDGNEIEAELLDSVPFIHSVYDMAGDFIGGGMGVRAETTYLGLDVAQGAALYAHAWRSLTEAERAEIDADRVAQP